MLQDELYPTTAVVQPFCVVFSYVMAGWLYWILQQLISVSNGRIVLLYCECLRAKKGKKELVIHCAATSGE